MTIRKYEPKDKKYVHEICLETSSSGSMQLSDEALFLLYADYYVDEEPNHVFIASDDTGKCVGYILCAANAEIYEKVYTEKYLPKIKKQGLLATIISKSEMKHNNKMAKIGYPAHMHIDLSPEIQRQGVGTSLCNTLFELLKSEGVSGIYLGCAKDNVKGNSFYTKFGFKLFEKTNFCNYYTYDLIK